MKAKKKSSAATNSFQESIVSRPPLRLRQGLQAIKKSEGKDRISATNPAHVLGSVAMDDDCKALHPNDSRWDYVVGYNRNGATMAHFVEVHSAETSEVSTVEKKFQWLRDFLASGPSAKLRALPAEFHWVASGRVRILPHTPQYKKLHVTLRKLGLRFAGQTLELT